MHNMPGTFCKPPRCRGRLLQHWAGWDGMVVTRRRTIWWIKSLVSPRVGDIFKMLKEICIGSCKTYQCRLLQLRRSSRSACTTRPHWRLNGSSCQCCFRTLCSRPSGKLVRMCFDTVSSGRWLKMRRFSFGSTLRSIAHGFGQARLATGSGSKRWQAWEPMGTKSNVTKTANAG